MKGSYEIEEYYKNLEEQDIKFETRDFVLPIFILKSI
jgi:hypothetical protein